MSAGVCPDGGTSGGSEVVDRARALARLFSGADDEFGVITSVESAAVPPRQRLLLDHHGHMTVAMEREHGGPVGLRVVAEHDPADDGSYSREILLSRADGRVVQYGIVRIDLRVVPPDVAAAIRGRAIPLGRILLAAGLLCDVEDVRLVQIRPGPHLDRLVGVHGALHGRVADIRVAGAPALELLEVVVPA